MHHRDESNTIVSPLSPPRELNATAIESAFFSRNPGCSLPTPADVRAQAEPQNAANSVMTTSPDPRIEIAREVRMVYYNRRGAMFMGCETFS